MTEMITLLESEPEEYHVIDGNHQVTLFVKLESKFVHIKSFHQHLEWQL